MEAVVPQIGIQEALALAPAAKIKTFYSALREMVCRRAKADLFFLAKYVLGADRVKAGRSKFDFHHEELCRDLMRMAAKRLDGMKQAYVLQWPRGTMKSTILTAFCIWILLNDPNARILIDCESATNAGRFLKVIKGYFESPAFQEIFGVLYDKRKGWSEESITITRTADGIKEPSIDIGGVEKEKTGNHYDYILSDDIVGETNSKTIGQIQKAINHAALYTPLLDSEGLEIYAMTRWAFNDLGEHIHDENKAALKDCRPAPYVINRKPAFKEDAAGNFTDVIEFPTLHSRNSLMQALNKLKPYQFSCQMLLRPQSPTGAPFRREWLKYIGEHCEDIPLGHTPPGATVYIAVDPAMAQRATSDYTSIAVAAITPDFKIFVIDIVRGHFTKKEIYDHLVALNTLYRPAQIGVEAVFKMKEVLLYIEMQAKLEGKILPLKTFKSQTTNKANRILGLQPLVQHGKFYMRRRMGDFVYLEDQMLKFDPVRIDAQENDVLDSVAYFVEMMHGPEKSTPTDDYVGDDWLERLEEFNKKAKEDGRPQKKILSYSTVRAMQWQRAKAEMVTDENKYVTNSSLVLT